MLTPSDPVLGRAFRVAVVFALLVGGAFAYQWRAATALTASEPSAAPQTRRSAPGAAPQSEAATGRRDHGATAGTAAPAPGGVPAPPAPQAGHGALGAADGAVPDGTSVFDDAVPGVANLEPDLRGAVRRAASDAAAAGVRVVVDSGWRSARYQEQLRREAVAKYGSEAEAARWVAAADRSAHVSGNAIDLGPKDAARWLADHGAAYGLCRVYANEPWHFEFRAGAVTSGCPARYADPTHDPRLQP